MSLKIRSRIWIELEDQVFLGEGRVQVLKAIDEMGSLSKAAKSLNMSYKKAWRLVDSVNASAKRPVIISSIGGKEGGGTQLTPYGKSLVHLFDEINQGCWDYLDTQLDKIEQL
ncbi:MAG TPA: winged helix-turn-helix domain-containing protein [Flavobacteriaceae bacterium]|nr:winged helix-turn-helix domain-containing protein [Flavobacteriaceae bacterium]MCB9212868.1 winged helix-turn-helix domain-containing protein [Alteromonas sp.]HPF11460.1 winged helix-turn-helix domain-containing protein [Flavobacteriaceae bacterium]HQU20623.1 winged helix-turn-helix domain-containing protein [Flavobacteriaceae bacterium]HQU65054.1 winged helix-turn-helix domain-containing protein [Flavobacteriaceae bacterium]